MNETSRFSLQQHEGPYAAWPQRTQLFLDGSPTAQAVRGYSIFRQFELDDGFLLVLDYDCPFEEVYEFYLLSPDLRLRSRASDPSRGALLASAGGGAVGLSSRNLLCTHEVLGPRCVRLLGCSRPPHLEVRVRQRRPLLLGSLLQLRWVAG